MSIDGPATPGAERETLPDPEVEHREGPKPAAHGSAVQAVFNDLAVDVDVDAGEGVYGAVLDYWREHVGDRENEPYPVAEVDRDTFDWLPSAREGRDWVLVLTSSRWKAGRGEGDDYRAYYEYHLKLRERDEDGDLHKPPLALHMEIMPQFEDLQYQDGNALETPYGEGTRVLCWTTWAEDSEEIEHRMLSALEAAVDADRDALRRARDYDSRRIVKAEAHHRFDIGWKRQVIEAVEQSKQLIAYGGASEIDAHQTRQREGYLEAVVDADRWHLLGFERTPYDIELKVYQASGWADFPREDFRHHPKIEASFAGVNGNGALPHVDDWDETLGILRDVVLAHLNWADVDRENLIADDYQPGAGAPTIQYAHPLGRREQLRERYEAVSTEIYREALKSQTTAVYDILRTVAMDSGASYDTLEERTGLARSTIRYHVRRLSEVGVVDRVGNPVIVVFPSLDVLDRAEEILRTVYPDDVLLDMNARAEERRERREEKEHPDGVDADDVQEDGADDRGDDGRASTWEYFADLDIEPHQLANALERDYLDENEVRVRTDRRDWVR
jgi:DNA-binding MarR family transcriptional regulator